MELAFNDHRLSAISLTCDQGIDVFCQLTGDRGHKRVRERKHESMHSSGFAS